MGGYTARAGDFRHRIKFQTRVLTQDPSTGALTQSWVDYFTCWALIEPVTGKEIIAAGAVQSSITHAIATRWRTEFAAPIGDDTLRILYGTRTFNINAVINESERNHVVTVLAEEGLQDNSGGVNSFNLLTEAGDVLTTEAGDRIVTEAHP